MTSVDAFTRIVGCAVIALLAHTTGAPAGECPALGRDALLRIAKPGQMALAPSGDQLAIADRFDNRIVVLDTRGTLLWSTGEGAGLDQPLAVMMPDATSVCFVQKESQYLLRVYQRSPQSIDTLTFLTPSQGSGKVRRLCPQPDGSCLVLWENPDCLERWSADWSNREVLVKEGSRKGELNRPTGCLLLSANRIAVSGAGRYPVQVFDRQGNFLMLTDWNSPSGKSPWEATALTVDHRARLWVADLTGSRFRVYDQVGNLLLECPFSLPASRPVEMAVSSDNQLIVLYDSGRLEFYDLFEE